MNNQDEVRGELKEIRYRWRGFAVVDNSFEDLGVSQNADRIADFFLSEFATLLAKKRGLIKAKIKEYREQYQRQLDRGTPDPQWGIKIETLHEALKILS